MLHCAGICDGSDLERVRLAPLGQLRLGCGMVSPRVSIIIPHLNQHEALMRCLGALRGQGAIEIIVVDNGSRVPLDSVKAAFGDVRFLREPTPGPGPARNLGVAHAGGDVLAFIDADCRADPHWVAAGLTALARGADVVGGDVRIDVADPQRLTPLEAYESVFAYRQQLYIRRDHYSGTGNLMVRRDVLEKVGPFAGIGVAEDADWGKRAAAQGHAASYAPAMIVYHPARRDYAEIESKWRRHIAHDRAVRGEGVVPKLKWEARRWVLLLSWLPDNARLFTSPRLRGFGNRLRGVRALIHTRVFRFREMGVAPEQATRAEAWNRR
jgi:glycosyltransferase involved in cell wall biosynthesis